MLRVILDTYANTVLRDCCILNVSRRAARRISGGRLAQLLNRFAGSCWRGCLLAVAHVQNRDGVRRVTPITLSVGSLSSRGMVAQRGPEWLPPRWLYQESTRYRVINSRIPTIESVQGAGIPGAA
jgi:hypothetical protein